MPDAVWLPGEISSELVAQPGACNPHGGVSVDHLSDRRCDRAEIGFLHAAWQFLCVNPKRSRRRHGWAVASDTFQRRAAQHHARRDDNK